MIYKNFNRVVKLKNKIKLILKIHSRFLAIAFWVIFILTVPIISLLLFSMSFKYKSVSYPSPSVFNEILNYITEKS